MRSTGQLCLSTCIAVHMDEKKQKSVYPFAQRDIRSLSFLYAVMQMPVTAGSEFCERIKIQSLEDISVKEKQEYKFGVSSKEDIKDADLKAASRRIQDVMEVGERIWQSRKSTGVSQEKLAELIGVNNNTIHRAEGGRYAIGIDTFFAIADALDTPIEEICPERFARIKRRADLINIEFQYARLNEGNKKVVYETIMTLINALVEK